MHLPFRFLAVLAALSAAAPSPAQIGFRQVTSTHPVAVQRGKTTEVQVRCNFTLDGCYQTFFDRPGMTLEFAETKPKAAPRRGRSSVGTPFKFIAKVPADCPLGIRETRFATPQAVSSCGMLKVTNYPVAVEKDDNDVREKALQVSVPFAACGVVEKREDVDFYAFEAKAGQTLVFECFAQRISEKIHNLIARGGYLMDSILTLYDESGREINQNDDYYGGDSLMIHQFKETGKYFLSVRDTRYNGNPCYSYCVEVSDYPFIQSTFPLAVRRGEETELELTGYNLNEPRATVTIERPVFEDETVASFELSGRESNPVRLRVTQHPAVFENTLVTEPAKGRKFDFPAALHGQISEIGDADHFVFSAAKGQSFTFTSHARRYGSLLDSMISISDAKGNRLVSNDDGSSGRKDSALTWKAPADGEYVLTVADLSGNGGRGFPYCVEATVARPDFSFRGEYYYAMLAPGNHVIWFVRVDRKNGFAEPITFSVENLPQGVHTEPLTLPGHFTDGALILRADADAPVNASLVRVKGVATVKRSDGSQETLQHFGTVTCEIQSQGGGQGRWPINTQLVGVTEKMDIVSAVATPSEITVKPGESAQIDVEIKRHKDYQGKTVTLETAFKYFNNVMGAQLPPGVKMSGKSETRLTGNKSKGTIILEVDKNAKPVTRLPVAPLVRVSVTFSIATNYCTNPVYLTIVDPEKK